jgi:hypothetical protein
VLSSLSRCCVLFWIVPLFAYGPYLGKLQRGSSKIDVVYTWVDGQEASWQARHEQANRAYSLPRTFEANFRCRFRNRNELKYSMRSVYMFMEFVRHIYIVTDGQRPEWLQEHPMVSVVRHSDIFKNQGHLPTFNSMAIEANLHHIPGLQERFIYFNDDVFVGRPLKKRDFYSKHGKPKLFVLRKKSARGRVSASDRGFTAGWKNANAFFSNLGFKKRRKVLKHTAFSLRKSHLEQFERLFPQVIEKNASHKFRSPEDVCIVNGLIQYFALHHKQARKGSLRSVLIKIGADFDSNYKKLDRLLRKRPHLFCLEDVENIDNLEIDEQLRSFLEMLFYEKAPWEA